MGYKLRNTTIGEFCPFVYGKALKAEERIFGKVPVYGSNGIVGHHNSAIVSGPGIIIGRKGSAGELHLSETPFWAIDTTFYITGFSINELRYIYYLLKSLGLNNMNSDSAVPGLNRDNAHQIGISIQEEKVVRENIGEYIGNFDYKIANNDHLNKTLEEIAQVLFKSWFVDFEPVKAKMQAKAVGIDSQLEAMKAISGKTKEAIHQLPKEEQKELAETADLFPDDFEESDLGLIPEGWKVSEIGKEVSVFGGATPSTKIKEFWEDGTNYWTTPKDLSGLKVKILIDTQRKITNLGVTEISSGLLPKDTVLLSSRAPVGYIVISKVPISINQGFIAMVCKKKLPPEYIVQWLENAMTEIINRASGTTFLEISKKNFNPIKLVVPTKLIVENYLMKAKPIYDIIEENIRQSKLLTTQRDVLLPKLLSGDIKYDES